MVNAPGFPESTGLGCGCDPVSPRPLGLVQRLIGPFEERFRRVVGRTEGRDADRDGYLDGLLAFRNTEWFDGNLLAKPLADEESQGNVGVGHGDDELLAAHPASKVDAANRLAQSPRELTQHVVADRMAVAVVDRLEVVDIED